MTAKEIAAAYVEIGADNPHAGEILTIIEKSGKLEEVHGAMIDLIVIGGDSD